MTPVDPPASRQSLRSSATPPAPIAWPGMTAAACLTFEMDAESAVLDPGVIESPAKAVEMWTPELDAARSIGFLIAEIMGCSSTP